MKAKPPKKVKQLNPASAPVYSNEKKRGINWPLVAYGAFAAIVVYGLAHWLINAAKAIDEPAVATVEVPLKDAA